jgi:hypothetical protein
LGQGTRRDYVIEGTNGEEMMLSSVEECAIMHYKQTEGFANGKEESTNHHETPVTINKQKLSQALYRNIVFQLMRKRTI